MESQLKVFGGAVFFLIEVEERFDRDFEDQLSPHASNI